VSTPIDRSIVSPSIWDPRPPKMSARPSSSSSRKYIHRSRQTGVRQVLESCRVESHGDLSHHTAEPGRVESYGD